MNKQVPSTSPAAEATVRSAPDSLPPPLEESSGGGGCSEPHSARSHHPSLPPEGEGAKTTLHAGGHGGACSLASTPSPSGGRPGWGPPSNKPSPLTTLNTHIAQASQLARQELPASPGHSDTTPWPTLRSAQRFHETWSRISAETEVSKAEKRAPDNAGPLNSHKLVLHTLSLMRHLSPDYLRGFLAQAETLLWLDEAHALPRQPAAGKGVAAKVARKKK